MTVKAVLRFAPLEKPKVFLGLYEATWILFAGLKC